MWISGRSLSESENDLKIYYRHFMKLSFRRSVGGYEARIDARSSFIEAGKFSKEKK